MEFSHLIKLIYAKINEAIFGAMAVIAEFHEEYDFPPVFEGKEF